MLDDDLVMDSAISNNHSVRPTLRDCFNRSNFLRYSAAPPDSLAIAAFIPAIHRLAQNQGQSTLALGASALNNKTAYVLFCHGSPAESKSRSVLREAPTPLGPQNSLNLQILHGSHIRIGNHTPTSGIPPDGTRGGICTQR